MYNSIEHRDRGPRCCARRMEKIITAPMVRPDIAAYQSPIDGRPINSRKQRMEDLKRNNCRPWEGRAAEQQNADSIKASEDAKFSAGLEKTAANVLNNLSSASQSVLKGL